MKKITLKDGNELILDDEWYDMFKHVGIMLRRNKNLFYASVFTGTAKKFKEERIHNVIMDLKTSNSTHVDHINGNGLDCRKSNMRIATKAENVINSKRKDRKYTGVIKRKTGYWSYITVNGQQTSNGYYDTEIDAAIAYNKAVLVHYGQNFRMNEIDGYDYKSVCAVSFEKQGRIPSSGYSNIFSRNDKYIFSAMHGEITSKRLPLKDALEYKHRFICSLLHCIVYS